MRGFSWAPAGPAGSPMAASSAAARAARRVSRERLIGIAIAPLRVRG